MHIFVLFISVDKGYQSTKIKIQVSINGYTCVMMAVCSCLPVRCRVQFLITY